MEWGILLLLLTGRGEPSGEARTVVAGPCCGPQDREAEVQEFEAGG